MMRYEETRDPFTVDVNVPAHRVDHWDVTVTLTGETPRAVAEDVIEALTQDGHMVPAWLTRDVLAAALSRAVVKLTPDQALDTAEVLNRAGTHPGECRKPGCRWLAFSTGLCRDHWDEQQRAVEARIAAQAERIQESWRSGWGSLSAAGERGRSA